MCNICITQIIIIIKTKQKDLSVEFIVKLLSNQK